jgi:hypothetical protein
MPDTPTVADLRGVNDPEKTKCCDACDHYWEPDFFCEKCSGLQRDPRSDMMGFRESPVYSFLSICKNCCDCHLR